MTPREIRQDAYTEKGDLFPLTWGRLKIARRALDGADDEDYPDIAAAIYLMEFAKLRTIPRDKFVAGCCKFAQGLEAAQVVAAGLALNRDMGAILSSEIEPVDSEESGKQNGVEPVEAATPPPAQPSLQPL